MTDGQPTEKTGHMGAAVGWLATVREDQWADPDAAVVQRPDLRSYPGGVAGWKRDHPGKVGLTAKDFGMAAAMATALQAHPLIARLLRSAHVQVEHTVLARHAATGVQCKARPDLRVPGLWCGDLKMTKAKDVLAFGYSIADYGYDLQGWLYEDIEASRHGLERLKYGYDLIVVSRAPPHRVAVYPLTPTWLARGRRLAEAALAMRQIHEQTEVRPTLWWEESTDLPGPTRTDSERERRIHEHVRRLRDRANTQRSAAG